MNHVAEYLPDYERLNAIRYGAVMELADRGITVRQFNDIVKTAQARVPVPTLSLEDIFKTALVFGIPAGTLAYVVNRSLKRDASKTKKMRKTLEYLNSVSHELKNNLSFKPN